ALDNLSPVHVFSNLEQLLSTVQSIDAAAPSGYRAGRSYAQASAWLTESAGGRDFWTVQPWAAAGFAALRLGECHHAAKNFWAIAEK
ncbi:MAG: hypothetical protein WAL20_05785, partial [Rhodomicrobium sp.]